MTFGDILPHRVNYSTPMASEPHWCLGFSNEGFCLERHACRPCLRASVQYSYSKQHPWESHDNNGRNPSAQLSLCTLNMSTVDSKPCQWLKYTNKMWHGLNENYSYLFWFQTWGLMCGLHIFFFSSLFSHWDQAIIPWLINEEWG